eukprot:2036458-Pyramimonas_sp.AAC.1
MNKVLIRPSALAPPAGAPHTCVSGAHLGHRGNRPFDVRPSERAQRFAGGGGGVGPSQGSLNDVIFGVSRRIYS